MSAKRIRGPYGHDRRSILNVRLCAKEKSQLVTTSNELGMTASELARRVLFPRQHRPISHEVADAFAKIETQLGISGNNLNQIVRELPFVRQGFRNLGDVETRLTAALNELHQAVSAVRAMRESSAQAAMTMRRHGSRTCDRGAS